MERRAFERIPTFFSAKLLYGNSLQYGYVTNLSKSGICIITDVYFPSDSDLEILIPLSDEDTLKFPVKFKRAVGILNPPQKYLDFVDSRITAL
jgi:hypothetical protein